MRWAILRRTARRLPLPGPAATADPRITLPATVTNPVTSPPLLAVTATKSDTSAATALRRETIPGSNATTVARWAIPSNVALPPPPKAKLRRTAAGTIPVTTSPRTTSPRMTVGTLEAIPRANLLQLKKTANGMPRQLG
ncbi:hypothetical protein BO94DRAFT_531097, partial [Aspergillus sclerotioniger CBS 115572]